MVGAISLTPRVIEIPNSSLMKLLNQVKEGGEKVQEYCLLTYPGNPDGCPNYGSAHRSLRGIAPELRGRFARECPPTEFLEDGILDFSREAYLIVVPFALGRDVAERSARRPELRDPYNKRYWQDRARALVDREAERFLRTHPGTIVDLCPEAHGVNLLRLYHTLTGEPLRFFRQWPPADLNDDTTLKYMCLAGYPKDERVLAEKGIIGRTK